ncbi:MAG: thiamine-phosphate kinase [Kiritimatiellaeota bacterium]|nr:thiamine-phosphate kinase [Kiritimatiellota bacterium]
MYDDEKILLDAIPSIFSNGPEVMIGPGDDCAVLDFSLDKYRLVAVDQLVSDIHYVKKTTAPAEIAVKLLRRNISDIAAMGGVPSQALLAMTLSAETWSEDEWAYAFLSAMAEEAAKWNVSVCGGDVSSTFSTTDVFSLTITGWVEKDALTPRSAARAGDAVFATGEFGGSFESGRHLSFAPRLDEARFLAGRFAGAMIDVSDGLLLDAARIADMSGLDVEIDESAVPIAAGATLEQALSEGEDYELLFSVSPKKTAELESAWPFKNIKITRIGVFTAKSPKTDSTHDGHDDSTVVSKGFTHFSK